MSKHYDPEQEAYDRGFIISERELPPGIIGACDLEGAIWIDHRLLQRERRAVIAHELAHVDIYAEQPGRMGGGGLWHDKTTESECDERAAMKLIDFDDLIDACKWSDSLEEAAEELNVIGDVVRARLRTLTRDEVRRFDYQVGRGYAARLRGKPLRRTPPLKRR